MTAGAACVPVEWFALALLGNLLAAAIGLRFVAARGGWSYIRGRLAARSSGVQAEAVAPHWRTRADLYAAAPAEAGHVVLVGDSLTEFGPWAELLGRADVLNRGIAGDTVSGVARRLGPLLQGPPRVVALLIGINDLLDGRAPDTVIEDIRALCLRIRADAPATQLVVQSLLPVAPTVVGAQHPPRIAAVNAALPTLAQAVGATFLDVNPALSAPACLSADGLHLSAEGYRRWASLLGEALA